MNIKITRVGNDYFYWCRIDSKTFFGNSCDKIITTVNHITTAINKKNVEKLNKSIFRKYINDSINE